MSVTPSVVRDSTGVSMESYARFRARRNGMGNVMQGMRPHQLRRLGASLNHVVEHDRLDREPVLDEEPAVAASNVAAETSAENHYGLAAVLGFPLLTTGQSELTVTGASPVEDRNDELMISTNFQVLMEQVDTGYSSEETERILRSPTHKRRRNALPDAFEGLDEESIDRIRLLHAASQDSSHDRW